MDEIKPEVEDEWSYAQRHKAFLKDKEEIDYEKQRDKLRKEQDKFLEKRDKQKQDSLKWKWYNRKANSISSKLEKIR